MRAALLALLAVAAASPGAPGGAHGVSCRPGPAYGLVQPCSLGVPLRRARRSVALIGDSHAAHWRSALAAVARRERWHVYAITRSGCPFAAAARRLPQLPNLRCARWKRDVAHWLRAHRRVSRVILAQAVGDLAVIGAADPFAAAVQSYVSEWTRLPASVRRVVVLRDTPVTRPDVVRCVRRQPARACALPEAVALVPDPAVAAAAQLGAPRFQTVDLTDAFCDGTSCFPAIDGRLAYVDSNHLAPGVVAALAPELDGRLRQLRGIA